MTIRARRSSLPDDLPLDGVEVAEACVVDSGACDLGGCGGGFTSEVGAAGPTFGDPEVCVVVVVWVPSSSCSLDSLVSFRRFGSTVTYTDNCGQL